MDSFATRDVHKADMVWQHDRELDDLVARVMYSVITRMSWDITSKNGTGLAEVESAAHFLFITKNLERVGDHATNIAEVIQFQISGSWKTSQRPWWHLIRPQKKFLLPSRARAPISAFASTKTLLAGSFFAGQV
jgi:phosphate uptake regulator